MNERIEELAAQAGISLTLIGVDGNGYQFGYTDHKQLKFVELIVRECVNALNEMHTWQSVNNQNYPTAWHDAVDNAVEHVSEHFGVE